MAPLTKLMPLYDQSESWIEFSGKILSKLNEVIREVNAYFEIDLDTYVVNLLRPWASADITVDSLDEGSEPTASITQDHNGTHLFLGLPKGDTGLSSYDYAVLNGYTGSLEDFTNDILGYTGAYAAQLAAETARDEAETARDEIVSLNLNHEKYLNWRRLTTNPASFYPVPQSPLYVRASGEPIQEGTGDPAPDNIRPILPWKASGEMVKVRRTGKNLLNIANRKFARIGDYANTTLRTNIKDDEIYYMSDNNYGYGISSKAFLTETGIRQTYDGWTSGGQAMFIRCKPNTSYTISTIPTPYGFRRMEFSDLGVFSTSGGTITTASYSFVTKPDSAFVGAIFFPNNQSSTEEVFNSNIQIELGSTATPYEPYSGEEITLTAPQDIYGGWLDNEGKWLITHVNIPSYAGESVPTGWKSSVGSLATGAQVVYPLAVPTALTITPKLLLALPQADRTVPRLNVVATDAQGLRTDYAKSPIQEENT